MNLKSLLAKPFALYIHKSIEKSKENALQDQDAILGNLIKIGSSTVYGKDCNLHNIKSNYAEFSTCIPIKDYENLKPYIDKIKLGEANVLWKGKPLYFAKTSGTTSGIKYIPITKDSISNHINTARNALLCYMVESGNYQFANGKMIFLSGSPELERVADIATGRLSGIVNHHIPKYLRSNQLPTFTTNCIEDWEEKLDKIVEETINQDMTLISGIPPWMQMYFDRIIEKKGKKIAEVFKNFSVMVQGGVNFEPYKQKLFDSIGKKIDSIELFPASEGFFAFQDNVNEQGLLLNTNSGIFYEFIDAGEIFNENPTRISLHNVQLNKNYALIINSNAGLWGYNIGDTVKFISLMPYRIVVTGRIKHFISAFGEHVIAEEVEAALLHAAKVDNVNITEFTIAPNIAQGNGKSYHEWFIEFENLPNNITNFAHLIDEVLRQKNVYYDDLIRGNILEPLKINIIQKNGFINYMKSEGKLGGQNKVARLSNDRIIANKLLPFLV
jgi:phenylacetate-coenzyme A ligase PaaK-like adenylate-forming protein